MINHKYPYPMVVVSGGVITEGHFGDLKDYAGAVSVGLYDKSTYHVATGSGNGDTFFIGYSSPHTRDEIMKFYNQAQKPNKSYFFRGKDVIKFEVSEPKRKVGEIVTLGWNGSDACTDVPCTFECGKTYGVSITLSGSPTFRNWARTLEHEIYVTTPCCDSDDCNVGCPDGQINCAWVYEQFATKINNHIELKRSGVKARYIMDNWSAYGGGSATHFDYTLTVCDAGDSIALNKVQSAIADEGLSATVTRTDRIGGESTYSISCIATADAPADFQPSSYNLPPDCTTCATGYTLQAAQNIWTVTRPLGPSDDVTLDQTVTVETGTTGIVQFTIGATVADETWDTDIATTLANLVTNEAAAVLAAEGATITSDGAVLTISGGGTVTPANGAGGDYTFSAVTTQQENFAAAIFTAYDVIDAPIADSAVFLSTSGGNATVQLSFPVGATPTQLDADTLLFTRTQPAICIPDSAPSAVAWVQGDGYYKTTRTLCIQLPRLDCDANNDRETELEAFLVGNSDGLGTDVTVTSGDDGCTDTYTVTQTSNCLTDGCLAYDTPVFKNPQGFDGFRWEEPAVTPGVFDADRKCGLVVTADLPEVFFDECVTDLSDYYETQPMRIELGMISNEITGLQDNCDICLPNVTKIQNGSSDLQSGHWLYREYVASGAYELYGYDFPDARLRAVLDAPRRNQVDRKTFYKIYYIQYVNDKGNSSNFNQKGEVVEACVAFKETDPNAAIFESQFGAVLSKFGVTLQERK